MPFDLLDSMEKLSANWSETNSVRVRTKGEVAGVDAQWAMTGASVKSTFSGISALSTTNGLAVSASANAVGMTAQLQVLACDLTTHGIHLGAAVSGRVCSQIVRHDEFNSTFYRGRYRRTEVDPPLFDVVVTKAAPLAKESPPPEDGWIELTADDLKKIPEAAVKRLNGMPEWKDVYEKRSISESLKFINSQIPVEDGDPCYWSNLPAEPLSIDEAKARNASFRLDITTGARQSFTVYPAFCRNFTLGRRMSVHFDAQRDIYREGYGFTAKRFYSQVRAEELRYFKSQMQYVFERSLDIRVISAIGQSGGGTEFDAISPQAPAGKCIDEEYARFSLVTPSLAASTRNKVLQAQFGTAGGILVWACELLALKVPNATFTLRSTDDAPSVELAAENHKSLEIRGKGSEIFISPSEIKCEALAGRVTISAREVDLIQGTTAFRAKSVRDPSL
ncbi:hypothetical protein [Variovorax saccharolyticus]|uniref:hypothetical protein n=1 Tax=Variovorax saccharolyticus TaxID=3053516 RepID=UPI00257851C3|nr:hypothetical protein [Variovorax sp. J31P216]MDM0030339.1 hypothetical protein [Variovorax sp. J31P216]